jgi:hypothetical protein
MKKIMIASTVMAVMMSCGGANDGKTETDTTNFNTTAADTGSLSPAYGDTSRNLAPSTGTDTVSRPYSGNGTQSSADSGMKQ